MTVKKAIVNYLKRLVREVEPIDSPNDGKHWSLEWDVDDSIEVEDGLVLVINGLVTASVDKIGSYGIIDLNLGSLTFRFTNKALCKEIINCAKAMYGICDAK
jgi:hypothetical protein